MSKVSSDKKLTMVNDILLTCSTYWHCEWTGKYIKLLGWAQNDKTFDRNLFLNQIQPLFIWYTLTGVIQIIFKIWGEHYFCKSMDLSWLYVFITVLCILSLTDLRLFYLQPFLSIWIVLIFKNEVRYFIKELR